MGRGARQADSANVVAPSALDRLLDDEQRAGDLPRWTQGVLPDFDPARASDYTRRWLQRLDAGSALPVVLPHGETGLPQRASFQVEQLQRPLAFMQAGLLSGMTWRRPGQWEALTAQLGIADRRLTLNWDRDARERDQMPRTSPWARLRIDLAEFSAWQADIMPLFADDLELVIEGEGGRVLADRQCVRIEPSEGDEEPRVVAQSAQQMATMIAVLSDDRSVENVNTWCFERSTYHGLELRRSEVRGDCMLAMVPEGSGTRATLTAVRFTPGMMAEINAQRLR